MKVILYIGHHKVGSTALQVFLSQNWLKLIRAGILYPSVESRGFAQNLARVLGEGDKAAQLPVNIREPHSALAYRMMSEVSPRKVPSQFIKLPATGQMFQALHAQINHLKPKAVVLCSEAFANFGAVQPSLVKLLCDAFPDAEFEVYCALRRPDDYLVSWHGQRLKAGEQLKPLRDGGTKPYFETIHFDFRNVLRAWVEQVPDARLIIRNYTDILAAGGSTEDFITQCGIDFPADLIPAGRANLSLPRAAMELVRRGNHDLSPEHTHALCQYLLSDENGLKPVSNKDVEMFEAPLRREMAEQFSPIHDYLSDLVGHPFFPDIDAITQTRPIPESRAAADLLAQIDPAQLAEPALRDYIGILQRQSQT